MIPIIPQPVRVIHTPIVIHPQHGGQRRPLDSSDFCLIGGFLLFIFAFLAIMLHPATFYYFDKYVEWSVSLAQKWKDEDKKKKDEDKKP